MTLAADLDSDSVPPPTQASGIRRVVHAVIALAGWVTFGRWWWIVFHRVSSEELRSTGVFIGVSLLVVVGATSAWAWHNLRIYRQRGPRKHVRVATPKFGRDRVGRAISVAAQGASLREAAVVIVRVVGLGKTYDTAASVPPAPVRDIRR